MHNQENRKDQEPAIELSQEEMEKTTGGKLPLSILSPRGKEKKEEEDPTLGICI